MLLLLFCDITTLKIGIEISHLFVSCSLCWPLEVLVSGLSYFKGPIMQCMGSSLPMTKFF